MRSAYILAALRTPGCKANKGKLRHTRPDDLAAVAIKAVVDRTGIDPMQVEDIILGCAFPEGEQGMNVARVAGLKAGLPHQVPAQTVNRFCSSGLQSYAIAAQQVMAGFADCIIAGGVESMSMVPMGGARFSANPGLVEDYPESFASMGVTAELVADKYGISRQAQDEFAFNSHMKAAKAIEEGRFADEIIPVETETSTVIDGKMKKAKEIVDIDDGVRPDTTVTALSKLRPVFKVDGSVTAGNSSQITDGAAVGVVVSEDFLGKMGKEPVARFMAFAARGVRPEIMGIGPVEAVPAALGMANLGLKDIGLIELNEAFAAQSLAVVGELGINTDILNVNGGAIALGHPLGCTGAKLTATVISEARKRKVKYGMVTMCVGGGMGAAGVLEIM